MNRKFNYWQILEVEHCYHLYNRSIGETNLFITDENYTYFLTKWNTYISPYIDVLAYCLMPNHFHFLIQPKSVDEHILNQIKEEKTTAALKYLKQEITYNGFLEDQFKRLFSSYSLAFNKQQNRKGSLIQKRFKRVVIQKPEQIINKLIYIHHNPIHHGFTFYYEDWKYSSYSAYFSNKTTKVSRTIIYNILKETFIKEQHIENAFKALHEEYRSTHKEYLAFDDF